MREDKNIHIVIGANFGDEGKGQMTDYFASKYDSSVVILSNGGAQRGHTVVTPEGARHVFHHFGSGSFVKGSKTYIPEYFVVNPVIFRQEREQLKRTYNLDPIVYIHPNCLLTTIYDMLLNQAIEFDRAKDKHGSCGIGLYETLYRNHKGIDFIAELNISPLGMAVKEFNDMSYKMKYEFLQYLRTWYLDKRLNDFHLKHDLKKRFYDIATNENVLKNYIDDFEYMMKHSRIRDYDVLENENNIIFENGQGILLDQHNMDYFPHLSPSNTGLRNPLLIMQKMGWQKAEACYVTRSYMTRHGAGRFDSECSKDMINKDMIDITNVPNPFQDSLRYGYLNEKSLRHRILKDVQSTDDINFIYEVDVTLALMHVNEFDVSYGNTYISWGMTRDNIAGGNLNFAFF